MARPRTSRSSMRSGSVKLSRGFTLVELLVVITIIGMLVSLLLPAIQAAREAGRRSTCQNNMRQCTLGLIQFAETKRAFPGYSNPISTGDTQVPYIRASWVVPILPQLERNDLYQNWQNAGKLLSGAAAFNSNIPIALRGSFYSPLDVLLCPSNSNGELGSNPLSYVANTGIAKTATDTSVQDHPSASFTYVKDDVNSGVFFNQSLMAAIGAGASPGGGIQTNADFISTRDGTTYTILLSENLQAGNWAVDPNSDPNEAFYQSDVALRQNTGMVWFLLGKQNNDTQGPTVPGGYATPQTVYAINDKAQDVTGYIRVSYNSGNLANPTGLQFSRPSANHSGGVLMTFVGGNGRYISEEIDYKVYTQLMTPNQKLVDISAPGAANPVLANAPIANGGWTGGATSPFYILDESEIR